MLDVINSVPGVRTVFSCCGHGQTTWYFTLAFTSKFMFDIASEFFKNGRCVLNDGLGMIECFDLAFKYRVYDNDSFLLTSSVPELKLAVHCDEFDQKREPERANEYKRICSLFAKFLVKRYW